MKKIVYLANAASIHTQRWVKYFVGEGYRVTVLSFEAAHLVGATVIPLTHFFRGKIDYFTAALRVRRIIHDLQPDLLHAHYASGYGFLGTFSGFHPYILSVWGSDIFDFPKRSPFHRSLLQLNLARADVLCSTSEVMASETRRYTDKDIRITPFGIDCRTYRPLSGDLSTDRLIIGTVKKMEPVYGIEYLIRAFALITPRFPSVQLTLIGDGSKRFLLEELARQLGIHHQVSFVGTAPQEKVPYYLNQFAVYVALSLSESFGVSVLEASACGIPVVATNVGGLNEVVLDGKTGFLVHPKNIEEPAAIIEKLLLDQSFRKDVGRQGREFVLQNYNWEKTARVMAEIYTDILC